MTAIRPAVPADAPAIAAIYRPYVEDGLASFELEAPDAAEMARRMAALAAGGFPWLVALHADGAVAGYGYAGPYRSRPAYRFTVEDSVYVSTEARGRGIGRALLEGVVAACEVRGYRQMVAVITETGSAASVALHLACGFVHAGTLPAVGWKAGAWHGTILMQRALGTGDSAPAPD